MPFFNSITSKASDSNASFFNIRFGNKEVVLISHLPQRLSDLVMQDFIKGLLELLRLVHMTNTVGLQSIGKK